VRAKAVQACDGVAEIDFMACFLLSCMTMWQIKWQMKAEVRVGCGPCLSEKYMAEPSGLSQCGRVEG
jgi:hypothetical protein